MIRRSSKWWLVMTALLLLTQSLLAKQLPDREAGCGYDRERKCRQVPEGGSTAAYLVGAGVICFGAMLVRSRLTKRQTA